ncbi:MAG: sulfatase-like hydrolase/transferase [Bacteroidales bacterium]|nr:sulfatase-like hydrolase/transferase [Bacteroidales bacterium]MCD8393951.1 sulfatase-like hydrolase/transferase [Bacteroidales bacterium]
MLITLKSAILKFLLWFVVLTALMALLKWGFMAYNSDIYAAYSWGQWWQVLWSGLKMDMSVAGYLTIIPGVLIIAQLWAHPRNKVIPLISKIYCWLAGVLIAGTAVADAVLYPFWGFKLDMTPLFYFSTSPSAAMASVSGWFVFLGILVWLVIGVALGFVLWYSAGCRKVKCKLERRAASTGVMVLLIAALFLPIRGSVTVSTMNPSRAYFSTDMRLNHAAVNPAFSLLYSAAHQGGDDEQFHFMDDAEAARIFAQSLRVDSIGGKVPCGNPQGVLSTPRPDIYIIILESFSAHLMPSLGGEPVTMGLDSIARSGLSFTKAFASGFRTDRAIPAILSGYPSMPTQSAMKDIARCERIPSLSQELVEEGYECAYYYGGDANFTNMLAFLRAAGFAKVVSDKDFPISERLSKWGVHDHLVLEKALQDALERHPSRHFTVIQTSSSHEPFEVPYSNPRFPDKRRNALAYTDSCVTTFVNALRKDTNWANTLVILVPDHYSVYPQGLTDPLARHHVPLVLTGGALQFKGQVDTPVDHTAIAATVLGMMGLPHDQLRFSRDAFDPGTAAAALFSSPGFFGWVTPTDTLVYDYDQRLFTISHSNDTATARRRMLATIQTLYSDFAHRQ